MILILGGTAEGRELAAALPAGSSLHSLAGRTTDPMTGGAVRSGGFGGVDGLITFLRRQDVSAVVDATHPFAARISRNAAVACAETGIPLVRLVRPGWSGHPMASSWHWVDDHAAAADAAARLGGPVLLTVGRQRTPDYAAALAHVDVVARVAELPATRLPVGWRVVVARGPFSVEGEREVFAGIRTLVTKDSGGSHTSAKLDVAAELGAEVVTIRRPAGPVGVPEVPDVAACLAWLG